MTCVTFRQLAKYLPAVGPSTSARLETALKFLDRYDPKTVHLTQLPSYEGRLARRLLRLGLEHGYDLPDPRLIRIKPTRKCNPPELPKALDWLRMMRRGKTRLALLLCAYCGLRIGEACRLRWSDVDLEKKILYIRGAKCGSDRAVTIPQPLADELSYYASRSRNGSVVGSKPDSIRKSLRWTQRKYGFRFRIHDLRHAHASYLLGNGVDVVSVSRRLGHRRVSTTLDIYAHLVPYSDPKTRELLDNLRR